MGIDTRLYPMTAGNDQPVVGLIGSMNWSPSRRAAHRLLNLWPNINEKIPSARLLIAGWNSESYLANRFPLPNATLIGEVADPFDFFSQVSVLTYPTPRGTGVKVKVLESFAYGVPVVSNKEGFEGLDILQGEALVAETDDEFVAQTVAVLSNGAERERVRQAARRLVEAKYSPVPTVDRLLDAYKRLGLM
jgi:glycosyltransferase involved in cell wall biosynthesis